MVPEIWCKFDFGLSNFKNSDLSLNFQKGNNFALSTINLKDLYIHSINKHGEKKDYKNWKFFFKLKNPKLALLCAKEIFSSRKLKKKKKKRYVVNACKVVLWQSLSVGKSKLFVRSPIARSYNFWIQIIIWWVIATVRKIIW